MSNPFDHIDFSQSPELMDTTPEEGETMGFVDSFKASRELDSVTGAVSRMAHESEFAWDPDYALEDLDQLRGEVPEQAQGLLSQQLTSARNQEHARFITDRFKEELALSQEISSAGGVGLAARLSANIFDEGAIGLSLALGPSAGFYKLSRMARAMRMMGLSAAENAALEATVMAGSQTRTINDVLIAGLAGAALGAPLGAVGKTIEAPRAGGLVEDVNLSVPKKADENIRRFDEAMVADILERTQVPPAPSLRTMGKTVDEVLMPPEVQPRPAPVEIVRPSEAEIKTKARLAEIDARIQEIADTEIPAPVRPQVIDDLPKVRSAVEKVDNLPEGATAAQRTAAKQEADKAKREFLKDLQKADPDGFAETPFRGINPKMADFRKWLDTGGEKALAKMAKAVEKEQAVYDKALEGLDIELDDLLAEADKLKQPTADDLSVGAAQAGEEVRPLDEMTDEVYDEIHSIPETALKNFRFGTYGLLAKSGNQVVKWLGDVLVEDTVGKVGHAVNRRSAESLAKRSLQRHEAAYARAVQKGFKDWKLAQGIRTPDVSGKLRIQFNKDVADAIEFGSPDANIMKAADAAKKVFKETLEAAQEAGVKGADQVEVRGDYIPHIADQDQWVNAGVHYSMPKGAGVNGLQGPLENLVYRGLRLDEETLIKVAKGYTRNVTARAAGVNGKYGDINRTMDPEYLDEMLTDMVKLDDLDPKVAAEFMKGVMKQADADAGKASRLKRRTMLDMSAEIPVRNKETGEIETLALRDLYSRNTDALVHSYARSLGGLAAIAQRTKGTPLHIRSQADFEDVIKLATNLEADTGPRKGSKFLRVSAGEGQDAISAEVTILKQAYNGIVGRPINDPNQFATTARRWAGDWNFMTSMGQVAFAQVAEFGPTLTTMGLRGMAHTIPHLRKLNAKDADGLLTDPVARLAEDYLGVGTEMLRGRTMQHWNVDPEALGKGHNVVEVANHLGRNTVAMPLQAMMTLQQRMLAISMLHEFAEIGAGRAVSKSKMNRLAGEGIDKPMLKRIQKMYKAHAKPAEGTVTKRIDPGFDTWEDREAREALLGAMFGMGRRAVQENDIGNINPFLQRNMGQTLFQFRTFVIGAWEKHLLHGIHHRDMETFMNYSLSMMFAATAYTAQQAYKGASMDERRKRKHYREKLNPTEIALASFSRSTWASIVPTTADTMLALTGHEGIFDQRSSGLDQNIVTGNPTVALGQRVLKTVGGVGAAATRSDYNYSQQDLRNLQYSLPGANMLLIQDLWNIAGSTLPARSER